MSEVISLTSNEERLLSVAMDAASRVMAHGDRPSGASECSLQKAFRFFEVLDVDAVVLMRNLPWIRDRCDRPREVVDPDSVTDVTFTLPGAFDLEDPVVMRAAEVFVKTVEEAHQCDVVASSHRSNDDGETWRAVVAERDSLREEMRGYEHLTRRLHRLLDATATALKGEPAPLMSHSLSDLPDVARRIVEERVPDER